jgi:hypothetical protein
MTIADPDVGPLVGLAGDQLVARGACRGLPCPIVSVDVRDGGRASLVDAAGAPSSPETWRSSLVVYESDPDGSTLEAIAPDGHGAATLATPPPRLRLVADASWSGGSAEHPARRSSSGPTDGCRSTDRDGR